MQNCNWSNPGANPYKGTVKQALEGYGFHKDKIAVFEHKINRSDFDALIYIGKDSAGSNFYSAYNLRDMYWGKNNKHCSGPVDMSAWHKDHKEIATVYCVGGDCIAIPKVCGNVSRIDLVPNYKTSQDVLNLIPEHNTVSEPATIFLVFVAVLFAAVAKKLRPFT